MAKAIDRRHGESAKETVEFITKMNKIFDCFNVSSYNEAKLKRNVFIQPYRSPQDFRLKVFKLKLL